MNADTSTTSTNKPTTKDYVYRVSAAVANAILVTLGIGLLFQTIAQFIHWQPLYDAGNDGDGSACAGTWRRGCLAA